MQMERLFSPIIDRLFVALVILRERFFYFSNIHILLFYDFLRLVSSMNLIIRTKSSRLTK